MPGATDSDDSTDGETRGQRIPVQPEDCHDAELQPVSRAALDSVELPDNADARAALDRLNRRAGDARLVQEMRVNGFGGPLYRGFQDALVSYALAVLSAWMFSGAAFSLAAERHLSLAPSDREREELRADPALRADLAAMTIASTLPGFRQRALIAGGWTQDGGASLTTYFMGATLYQFVNEFRRHRTATRRTWPMTGVVSDEAPRHAAAGPLDISPHYSRDPGQIVPSQLRVAEDLSRLTDRERPIVLLHLEGYSHAEIIDALDLGTDRVVEGVLYRWRVRERGRLKDVREDSP